MRHEHRGDRGPPQGRRDPVAPAGVGHAPRLDRIGASAGGRVPDIAAGPGAVAGARLRVQRAGRVPVRHADGRVSAGERVRHQLHVRGQAPQGVAARTGHLPRYARTATGDRTVPARLTPRPAADTHWSPPPASPHTHPNTRKAPSRTSVTLPTPPTPLPERHPRWTWTGKDRV
ncbi:hypothetical protein SGPA1_20805 [Streptomyces misionensis JCM 4497]